MTSDGRTNQAAPEGRAGADTADAARRLRVLFFAAAADAAGVRDGTIDRPASAPVPVTAATVLDAACATWPGLAPLRGTLALAAGERVLRPDDPVPTHVHEVAVLPPVSGG